MRIAAVLALSVPFVLGLAVGACGSNHGGGGGGTGDGGTSDAGPGTGGPPDSCVGLQCQVANCSAMKLPDTSVSGTVFAPNGTLPLFGVNVYIPNTDPGPLPEGSVCSRCTDALPGDPIVQAISNESGQFLLSGIPAGDNIPLVITSGKWRKQLVLPHVAACTQTTLAASETRLPRDHTEGDMPRIAIATGQADSLECLIRKLGIADSEISTQGGAGRVHLYAGNRGETQFVNGFPGGTGAFADAPSQLWASEDQLKPYDIVMLSCEGAAYPEEKPQAAMDGMKAYADQGGRVFASHWHNIWIEGAYERNFTQAPAVWPGIADWTNTDSSELPAGSSVAIDEQANPKGGSFATWMLNVGGSTVRDQILLQDQPPDPTTHEVLSTGRSTVSFVHPDRGEQWVYIPHPTPFQGMGTQNFQFTTPNEEPDAGKRCGKVVFSDMHVSGTSGARDAQDDLVRSYPDNCATIPSPDPQDPNALTPQEKALTFMFFDIASCVGPIL